MQIARTSETPTMTPMAMGASKAVSLRCKNFQLSNQNLLTFSYILLTWIMGNGTVDNQVVGRLLICHRLVRVIGFLWKGDNVILAKEVYLVISSDKAVKDFPINCFTLFRTLVFLHVQIGCSFFANFPQQWILVVVAGAVFKDLSHKVNMFDRICHGAIRTEGVPDHGKCVIGV